VSTLAGSDVGYKEGVGTNAQFANPWCTLVLEATTSSFALIVSDRKNYALRRVTHDGTVTLLAGNPTVSGFDDGVGTNARFIDPRGLAMNSNGDMYLADGNVIRIFSVDGTVSTLAGRPQGDGETNIDGFGTAATFFRAFSVAAASTGGVYVACYDDKNDGQLRKITAGGNVTTLLRNVQVVAATESLLDGRIFLSFAKLDYIGVFSGGESVAPFVGSIDQPQSTDGVGTNARFYNPIGISQAYKQKIYVADYGNHMIRVIENIPPPSASPSPSTSISPSASPSGFSPPSPTSDVGLTVGICFASVFLAVTLVYVFFQLRFKIATLKIISRQQEFVVSTQESARSRLDGAQAAPLSDDSSSDPVAIDPITAARVQAVETNNPISSLTSRFTAPSTGSTRKLVLGFPSPSTDNRKLVLF